MRRAYVAEVVRAAEAPLLAAQPEGALMAVAAAGLARVCAGLLAASGGVYGARVLLLVGAGNNGGDVLHAGALLARRGAAVGALLLGELRSGSGVSVHEAGLATLLRAGGRVVGSDGSVVSVDAIGSGWWGGSGAAPDLVVDGILGIGGRGGLRGRAAEVVPGLPPQVRVVAADVPSGVDADTGEVSGATVWADVTVTFGALKPGLLLDPGAERAGVVELVELGLDLEEAQAGAPAGSESVEVLQAGDVAALLPRPGRESDKYRRGVVGVAAGSAQYTGAAVLCVGGALHGGAGMVRYVGADEAADLVRARWPEAVVGEGRVQAWTVGSGGGADARGRLSRAVQDGVPLVVDADALGAVPDHGEHGVRMLLTPHAGELARLTGADRDDIEARRLHHARAAARELGSVVLLKGSTTVIARPDGAVRVNPTGAPALATAGSGDVLAGLCGALLAGGLDPFDAGSVGAWLHGLAGRIAGEGGRPVTAGDLVTSLPEAFRRALGRLGG